MYYEKDEKGISDRWMQYMKDSIISTGGRFSTSRMLTDYVDQLYIPLCNLYDNYYTDLEKVGGFNKWKESLQNTWKDIQITQENNLDDISIIPLTLENADEENRVYTYKGKVNLVNGGNYGYTFRVMPKHEMILDSANLNLIKWITK